MKQTLEVQNLKCGGCAHTITTKLAKIEGVNSVSVTVENREVHLDFEPETLASHIEEILAQLGYPSVGSKNNIISKVKSVVSCATGKLSAE